MRICDELLAQKRKASAKTAALFLMFYWLEDPAWDRNSIPTGIRGAYGDKLLSEQLTQRNITLHGAITAFAENVGWKGDVRNVRLSTDYRLGPFITAVAGADPLERARIADYIAFRFAESRHESVPLPPVGAEVLTFVRAKALLYALIILPTEGHVQQFLIAALLYVLRSRQGIEVRTHHPHAADKYDATAGDIEDWREGSVVRAYEVTVRDDWKNRISNFTQKMDRFGLSKYIIIAPGINDAEEWSVPVTMALALEPYGRDIAVVDIRDVVSFLAAELTALELRAAINKAYEYLADPQLSGRDEFKNAYRDVVRNWLDTVDAAPAGPAS